MTAIVTQAIFGYAGLVIAAVVAMVLIVRWVQD